ncbi:MAG: class I SAM-dependent methyltransferase [Corynebacterium sp.]|uniref:class I SAM-dependent methyltransferase n=1 Tax=Corynebacterium sp. TaxID=1720 RepID=UPI0026DB124D|nr:class I SAM-dependent methyltransferase [Corynebacterium sp.]MDO4761179.1 class I SAM-dependent methyltransferase [Corynebacterium sp.]
MKLRNTRARATFSRACALLRAVKVEQSNPDHFYSLLARDTRELIEAVLIDAANTPLSRQRVLDVGGGPGYFAEEFEHAGAWYVGLEPSVGEMSAAGIALNNAVRGDGMALPFADESFDVVYSSNVAEHVPHPWRMGEEMLRVCAPGGLIVLSYTVWLGPFGGHETGLWQHYVGGHFARERYEKKHGHPPKNVFGESLFALSCTAGLKWAHESGAEIVGLFPRYHPRWAWWVVTIPLLREFLTSNLVIVLRKTETAHSRDVE